jgi:hypothetical protein
MSPIRAGRRSAHELPAGLTCGDRLHRDAALVAWHNACPPTLILEVEIRAEGGVLVAAAYPLHGRELLLLGDGKSTVWPKRSLVTSDAGGQQRTGACRCYGTMMEVASLR